MGDLFGAKMRKVATLRNANNFLNKNNYGTLIHSDLNSATWHLRRSMQDDYTKFKNMAEFERLQAEIQQILLRIVSNSGILNPTGNIIISNNVLNGAKAATYCLMNGVIMMVRLIFLLQIQ